MAKNKDKFDYQFADNALQLMGKNITVRHKELSYSQKELAEKVGTSQQYIQLFESGKQNITIRPFIAIFLIKH